MCGICGIHGDAASQEAVDAMLEAMRRRGPDGAGQWSEPGIILGHRRLAIVDLSERGRQPMVAADGKVAITVNGEIYNYPQLRAELENEGASFASDCDSETVIHGWRAWGVESFARYNGMFAFALWDAREKALYLVRDRLGIKPLYYWREGARTIFASDAQAILAASGRKEWAISAHGLAQYLTYENRFGAATMFEGIRMLLPGHYLRVDAAGATEHAYARMAPGAPVRDFERAVDGFRAGFRAAVKRHLMSDVPIASYLSAGFDTAMVASTSAQELGGSSPATFTGTFDEGGWYDEASGAELIARRFGLPNTKVEITADSFRDAFDEMVFALEEPRMGTGALPQYLVAQKVAETHKLILTGHGGDELFSGYPVFKYALLARLLRTSPTGFLQLLTRIRLSEVPHIVYFALSGLFGHEKPFLPQLFSAREQEEAIRPDYRAGVGAPARDDAAFTPAEGGDTYRALLTQYFRDYLPGLLVVEDKISMAHGLESRTPFLDNELVSFALSIDEMVKLDGGRLKAITKEAARGTLPDELYSLPKRGFPNPLSKWLRGELADWMGERIAGPDTMLAELFDRRFLERAASTYLGSWRRHVRPLDEIATHRIWMLLCLESWLRQTRDRLGVQLIAPKSAAIPTEPKAVEAA
ncbi:MAG: asparagine synthase (glutamine-hydrolyzing) [Rhizobiaceae bacterium]|nr:asparagine synthase (glutamine-hydrolyzing) [Rhizobiaceae bacterium]